jgi:hypothetical protein
VIGTQARLVPGFVETEIRLGLCLTYLGREAEIINAEMHP